MKYVCKHCKKPPLILTRQGIREHLKEKHKDIEYGKNSMKNIRRGEPRRREPLSEHYDRR